MLGCERGSGFIHPRIQQQLQTHDISLLHHPHSHHSHNHEPGPTTHTLEQRESSTSEHAEWPDSGGGPHTSLAEENVEHILLGEEWLQGKQVYQDCSLNTPMLSATSIISFHNTGIPIKFLFLSLL